MQRDGVSGRVQRRVDAMREVANQCAYDLFFVPTEAREHRAISADRELIAALSGTSISVVLEAYCGVDDAVLEMQSGDVHIDRMRVVVLDFSEPSQGTGRSGRPLWYGAARCVLDEPDAGVETTLLLTGQWAHTPLWLFATIVVSHCMRAADGRLSTTGVSLVTLQPDFLVEATSLAACFTSGTEHPNTLLSVTSRYCPREVRWQAVAGIVAGAAFDRLVTGVDVDRPAFIDGQLRSQSLTLRMLSEDDLELIRRNVLDHAGTIRRAADRIRAAGTSMLEPFFASDRYGLQGRLDALVTNHERKTVQIIELKNGGVPRDATDDGNSTGVYPEHTAQAWCYELLVRSALGTEPSASNVVYLAEAFAAAYRRQDPGFDPAASIGIITPFRAQAGCIYRALPAHLLDVTVDTVERY